MLHRVLTVGLLAGFVAGVAITIVHLLWTVPLILDAEVYERFKDRLPPGGFDAAKAAIAHAGHADGLLSRHLLTLTANVLFGAGAGLMLAGLFNLLGVAGIRSGMVWGAAAFVAVSLAPALGLPPELPGTAAAGLGLRQAWFVATVAATAIAIALIARYRSVPAMIAALVLAAAPHVIGAPEPAAHESVVPHALAQEFVVASLLGLVVFWLVLGGTLGFLSRRLGVAERAAASSPAPA